MPTNLTDSPVFTSPVVVPTDGDAANAASVVQGFQPLANRTAFLNQVATGLETNPNGVTQMRNVASIAAMSALTGVSTNGLCFVPALGIFSYASGSSATIDGVTVCSATGMGSGRWLLVTQAILGAAYGIAQLNAVGQLPSLTVQNGYVSRHLLPFTTSVSTTSTIDVDITSYALTIATAVGRQFKIEWGFPLTTSNASYGVVFSPDIVEAATDHLVCGAVSSITTTCPVPIVLRALYTATTTSITIKALWAVASGATASNNGGQYGWILVDEFSP